ncbi:hypothetical protein M1N18_00720 [Dehalococcoidales bacterium]|nr:hypothetical protein [Dehalococcoidales bacterium]MCL0091273.1 hypothetical protein [Dehalococcoidales bacterium]MCL0091977.1 hypothetical protein [Dehalococcoidales bacterium]
MNMTSPSRHRIIVPDEWLVHDIRGDNGAERQQETIRFLEAVVRRCDHFFIRRPSQFLEKAYDLWENSRTEMRHISKFLSGAVLYNSQKTTFVDEGILIPQELDEQVEEEDRYLVEALLANRESILVSSDQPLVECVKTKNLHACLRDTFLPEYLRR